MSTNSQSIELDSRSISDVSGIPPSNTYKPVIAGFVIIILAFGGFGLWAAYAPLNSAAIAPGVISVDSKHKTVQHLEGGIIKQILVREGTPVIAGQLLVQLDDTQARSSLMRIKGQYHATLALEARLLAERDQLPEIKFSNELLEQKRDPEIDEILAGQLSLFKSREKTLESRIAILKQHIVQAKEEILGLNAQKAAEDKRLMLLADEIGSFKKMVDAGHLGKSPLRKLQREAAEAEVDRGEHVVRIARARQAISEASLQINQLQNDRLNEVIKELRQIQTENFDLEARMQAAEDVFKRLKVLAPQDGIVVAMKYHTAGGVVPPGGAILDIVPKDDKLVIEVRIQPEDIDVVNIGMAAQVRLTAYNLRTTPTVEGHIIYVSADRLEDAKTGQSYYKAYVEVDTEVLSSLDGIKLYPGMPAEVMIETGERTALEYLLSPITINIHLSFREE